MKTNELNQQEQQQTNGGQMMPAGDGSKMPWIWPEQTPGYVSNDGQESVQQDNASVSGTDGGEQQGPPYIR